MKPRRFFISHWLSLFAFCLMTLTLKADDEIAAETIFKNEINIIATSTRVEVDAYVRSFDVKRGVFHYKGESTDSSVLTTLLRFFKDIKYTNYHNQPIQGVSEGIYIVFSFSNPSQQSDSKSNITVFFDCVNTKSTHGLFDTNKTLYFDQLGKLMYIDQHEKWKWTIAEEKYKEK